MIIIITIETSNVTWKLASLLLGSKGFCRQNAIFRSSESANFVKNFATNSEFRQFFAIGK